MRTTTKTKTSVKKRTPKRKYSPDADPLAWAKAVCRSRIDDPAKAEALSAVRDSAVLMIVSILTNCPASTDRSTAVRKVREALMFAETGLSINWED